MKKTKITGYVDKSGKVHVTSKDTGQKYRELVNKPDHEVIHFEGFITKPRKTGSSEQKSYYFGVLLPAITEALREHGQGDATKATTDNFLRSLFLRTDKYDEKTDTWSYTISSMVTIRDEDLTNYIRSVEAFAASELALKF